MATDDDGITVDDLVTGKAAVSLGEGVIPSRALLIIETMSEQGRQLRFVVSEGMAYWDALGMLRSATLKIEADDLAGWDEDE